MPWPPRGVPVSNEPAWLAPKYPAAVTPYRFEIDPLDAQLATGLSLAAAPSGTGELTLSALSFAAGVATFRAAGGQPTRVYSLALTVARSDGAAGAYLLKLRVDPLLAADQPEVAPAAGFGTALTWTG